MAALTFNDLITKTTNVFKKDVYLVDNRYAVGGTVSEIENISEFLCIYSTEFMNVLKDKFKDNRVVSLLDIKKVKNEPKKYIKTDLHDSIQNEVIERKNKLEKTILSISNWNSFDFTEEEKKILFDQNKTIELFTDDERIPSVTITKSLFPLIKSTEAENLYYSVYIPDNSDELVELVISYDTKWFQVYNVVYYIKM